MCGRYYIEADDMPQASEELFRSLQTQLGGATIPRGEIFPTQEAALFTASGAQLMRWGFTLRQGRPVINARMESLASRPLFSASLAAGRAIVPASGFYEWKKEGGKSIRYAVFHPGEPMYMAGLFRIHLNSPEFVIVTTDARGEMREIHDRMPVLFTREEARAWLSRRTTPMEAGRLLEGDFPDIILRRVG